MILNDYLRDGYAFVEQNNEIKEALKLTKNEIISFYNKIAISQNLSKIKTFEELREHGYPILKKKKPLAASFFYDGCTRLASLQNLFLIDSLKKIISKDIFGDSVLAVNNYQIYMQAPNDDKNINGWHQDSGYFSEFGSSESSIVVWIPFHPIHKSEGALEIITDSHKKGEMNHQSNQFGDHKKVERNKKGLIYLDNISDEIGKNKILECPQSEIILMDYNLIHRSGLNQSNKTRISVIARFSNMFGKNYIRKYGIW